MKMTGLGVSSPCPPLSTYKAAQYVVRANVTRICRPLFHTRIRPLPLFRQRVGCMSRRLSGIMPNTPTGAPGPGHAPGLEPSDTAAGPAPSPEQLYFTRAEKKRIESRLLAGSAVFQAVALALVIAVNAGGVHEVGGHVFAEDAYIFTVRPLLSACYAALPPSRGVSRGFRPDPVPG